MIKVGRREEGLAALTDLIWEKCFLRVRVCNLPRNALTLRSKAGQNNFAVAFRCGFPMYYSHSEIMIHSEIVLPRLSERVSESAHSSTAAVLSPSAHCDRKNQMTGKWCVNSHRTQVGKGEGKDTVQHEHACIINCRLQN